MEVTTRHPAGAAAPSAGAGRLRNAPAPPRIPGGLFEGQLQAPDELVDVDAGDREPLRPARFARRQHTAAGFTSASSATRAAQASFARPFSGGAATRTFRASRGRPGSPCARRPAARAPEARRRGVRRRPPRPPGIVEKFADHGPYRRCVSPHSAVSGRSPAALLRRHRKGRHRVLEGATTRSGHRSSSARPATTAPTSTSSTTARRSPTACPTTATSLTGLREGRRPPLPDDAGPAGRAAVRLGLPRPPGGDGGGEGARHLRPRGHQRVRHRRVQRRAAGRRSCATRRSGRTTSPARPAGSTWTTTTRPSTSPTWRASCGPSSSCGTRA